MMVLVERDGTSFRVATAAASNSGVISRGMPLSDRSRGNSASRPPRLYALHQDQSVRSLKRR